MELLYHHISTMYTTLVNIFSLFNLTEQLKQIDICVGDLYLVDLENFANDPRIPKVNCVTDRFFSKIERRVSAKQKIA